MARPAFVKRTQVHQDTTANASPITTDAFEVTEVGHTVYLIIGHERGNTSDASALTAQTVTRGGQSGEHVERFTPSGGSAANEVCDIWEFVDAVVGNYAFSISHTGTTGFDIHAVAMEYDSGRYMGKSNAAYAGAADGYIDAATNLSDVPASAIVLIIQCVIAMTPNWLTPAYGVSRFTGGVGSGGAGSAMGIAEHAPASAGTITGLCYPFNPASGNNANKPNLVLAFAVEEVLAAPPRRPAQVMML